MKKIFPLLLICAFSNANAQKVLGTIQRNGPADTYPILPDSLLKGGFRIVADTAERNAIPSAARKLGMVVSVQSDLSWYQLMGGVANANWQPVGSNSSLIPDAIKAAETESEYIDTIFTSSCGSIVTGYNKLSFPDFKNKRFRVYASGMLITKDCKTGWFYTYDHITGDLKLYPGENFSGGGLSMPVVLQNY